MTTPHSIDPRALSDPRNCYPSDAAFYESDRPAHHVLPEDRPRGGPSERIKHPWTWGTVGVMVFFFMILFMGIALFP
jgi:hypothetical protein